MRVSQVNTSFIEGREISLLIRSANLAKNSEKKLSKLAKRLTVVKNIKTGLKGSSDRFFFN
jgi:hypothetical protein